jgi:UDP-N-acetylmuramoyl-tripeptide--D-alanyl-D-alanine ligase
MIEMRASEIASVVGGQLHGEDILVNGPAVLSSQKASPGSIFLAIKGERVDGHEYVLDAFTRGAVLAITTHKVDQRCIVVENVTTAISALAKYLRDELPELIVIGITGSQGKTTTKELLASVLAIKGSTIAPEGNQNNELGVPLTLLHCTAETRYCIIEMGARHQGDIAALCAIARPNIGVVLRVAAAHLGEFGSLEMIAATKSEMIETLQKDGVAVLGNYDSFTPSMKMLHEGKVITFGESGVEDIRAADIELRDGRPHFDLVTPEGRSTVALRLVGIHQISNALAAASIAHSLGFTADEIAGALSLAETHAPWRMELHELPDMLLINDAYNASPDSMAAALRTLAHLSQERGGESWAFLGKMAELGESSEAEHAAIGTLASEIGIDHLVAVGAQEYAGDLGLHSSVSVHHFESIEKALEIAMHIHRGDVILCKGSRSAGMEVLADQLKEYWLKKISKEEEVAP